MTVVTTRDRLLQLCNGNQDACSLIDGMWDLVEVWDDAVDRQSNESEDTINRSFLWALVAKDENPFLRAHPELRLAMQQMAAVWIAANALERSNDAGKVRTAYTLRCSPYLFFVSVVIAAAGVHNGAVAAAMLFGEESGDSFEAYMAEHLGEAHGMGKQGSEA